MPRKTKADLEAVNRKLEAKLRATEKRRDEAFEANESLLQELAQKENRIDILKETIVFLSVNLQIEVNQRGNSSV